MKKITLIFLVLLFIVCFIGCGGNNKTNNEEPQENSEEPLEVTESIDVPPIPIEIGPQFNSEEDEEEN